VSAEPDRLFADPQLAIWYDSFCPWEPRGDSGLYLPYVMKAGSVLDVGCGTGQLLHQARAAGHTGRLCGLDPADAMLDVARARSDIEWVHGDLSNATWDREFDLVVMSGHAFQVFVTDAELHTALTAILRALTATGRFAFETRNPSAREWEEWVPENAHEVSREETTVRMEQNVASVDGDLVRFSLTFTSPAWPEPEVSWSTLRFLDPSALETRLRAAAFVIDEQYGDWDAGPLTATSPEIITIARPR
jgi:SAM-dependent methyltransferase